MIGIPALYLWKVADTVDSSARAYNARATARALGTMVYSPTTPMPTATMPGWMMTGERSTPSHEYSSFAQSTPTPTTAPTQEPTPIPTNKPPIETYRAVGYSYYYPPFGPPNCAPQNWDDKNALCDDVTASGEKWSDWLGKGIAIPVQWKDDVPLMSTIRVHTPKILQGDYTVIDYCEDCIKDGYVYVDFLSRNWVVKWTTPILIEIIPFNSVK